MQLIRASLKLFRFSQIDLADSRVRDWFLMESPIPLTLILAMYLLLVYKMLPEYMEKRKPYNLKNVIRIYNILQVFASFYIVLESLPLITSFNWKCATVDYRNNPQALKAAKVMWFYAMLKFVDLLDTVFFVLRKHEHQLTFLHLYHHFGVPFLGWFLVKYIAGGESLYIPCINSFVHTLMYSYYFICTFPISKERILYLKKKITQLQLVQFGMYSLLFFPKLFIDCKYPKAILLLFLVQNLFMIFLFGDFYYKNYVKGKKNANGGITNQQQKLTCQD